MEWLPLCSVCVCKSCVSACDNATINSAIIVTAIQILNFEKNGLSRSVVLTCQSSSRYAMTLIS